MTEDFNKKLTELLKTDLRFVDDEGELVVATIIGYARKFDPELIKLLFGKPKTKKEFFVDAGGSYIFKIDVFVNYIADKNFFADSYTRFRNKIGLNIDNKFLRERGEVSLVWPYKDCILEGGQTDEQEKNRKEIFFNEVLAHDEITRLLDRKVLTNGTRYTTDGRQKISKIKRDEAGVIRENLIVEGNNLLALHTLRRQFQGKVKLIYIDPPYNTGKDSFGYNDNFNHSTWLTFMSNRLSVAREFLRDDGVIFISCDDSEQAYLKVLCDEIFGKENFIDCVVVVINLKGNNSDNFFAGTHEYGLIYAKQKNTKITFNHFEVEDDLRNWEVDEIGYWKRGGILSATAGKTSENTGNNFPIYVGTDDSIALERKKKNDTKIIPISDGIETRWYWGKEKFLRDKNDVIVVRGKDSISLYAKQRINFDELPTKKPKSFLYKPQYGQGSGQVKKEFERRFNFSNPKSVSLLKDIFYIFTNSNSNDIILDFFAGSGTTGHATLALNAEDGGNRKFILCEQIDKHFSICKERLEKVLRDSEQLLSKRLYDEIVIFELMQYNESYMDKIHSARSSKELIKLWDSMVKDSFLNWYVNPKMPKNAFNDFILKGKGEDGLDKQKQLLADILDKNHLYVNLSEIDDKDFKVSKEDKKLNQLFHESR